MSFFSLPFTRYGNNRSSRRSIRKIHGLIRIFERSFIKILFIDKNELMWWIKIGRCNIGLSRRTSHSDDLQRAVVVPRRIGEVDRRRLRHLPKAHREGARVLIIGTDDVFLLVYFMRLWVILIKYLLNHQLFKTFYSPTKTKRKIHFKIKNILFNYII